MKLGVLEEKTQEEIPPLVLCAGTGTAALQTAAEPKGTRRNSAGHGKRSHTKHGKWYQGENEGFNFLKKI